MPLIGEDRWAAADAWDAKRVMDNAAHRRVDTTRRWSVKIMRCRSTQCIRGVRVSQYDFDYMIESGHDRDHPRVYRPFCDGDQAFRAPYSDDGGGVSVLIGRHVHGARGAHRF